MNTRGQNLGPAWYLDHANGDLSLGERVFMDAHIELDAKAAEKVAACEAVAGQMLADIDIGPLDPDSVGISPDDIFAMDGDTAESFENQPGQMSAEGGPREASYLPYALTRFLDESGVAIKWQVLGPKLRKCLLWQAENGTRLWMLKAEGGAVIPTHSHRGSELTLVLKGSFHDQSKRFVRGEVQEADDETEHDIVIDQGETCICLALTQAPLYFSNPLFRLYQKFVGI